LSRENKTAFCLLVTMILICWTFFKYLNQIALLLYSFVVKDIMNASFSFFTKI